MELALNNGMVELNENELYEIQGGVAPWVLVAAGFLLGSVADWAISKILDWGYAKVADMMGW